MTSRSRKRNKYGAKQVIVDGRTFHSDGEANRYLQLKLLQRAGEITDLECQPKFHITCGGNPVLIKSKGYPNGRKATYSADFRYVDTRRGLVVEDFKGFDTYESRLKRALIEAEYGLKVEIVK